MSEICCPNCGKRDDEIVQRIGGVEKELAIDGILEVGVHHFRCRDCSIEFWIAYGK